MKFLSDGNKLDNHFNNPLKERITGTVCKTLGLIAAASGIWTVL